MTDLSDYVDARQLIDGYQQLPCRYCGKVGWYNPHFCYNHDEGLCELCAPGGLTLGDRIEVSL